MGKVCWSRVLVGGIVAGLVIIVSELLLYGVVLADRMAGVMQKLSLAVPNTAGAMFVWVIYGLVLGIAAVWLYAAIRPRYGAGVKTALCAGVAVWFFANLLPTVATVNMGLFPLGMMVTATIWGLVELGIATTLGAWLYREPSPET